MLTISIMGSGRERYYIGLAQSKGGDYYVAKEHSELEPAGLWLGKGAERLWIEGKKVDPTTFRNLYRGFSPDGSEKWVQNAGRIGKGERDRMPGFDLTFGLPKSVSIASVVGDKAIRMTIERAAREAITTTLGEIEKGCIVRSGSGGKVREKADLIAAVFQHVTARQVDKRTPPDMHLHFHTTVINTGITASGKTGALQGMDFLNKTFAKDWGAKFRSHLEHGLNQAGFETVRTENGFELKGISREAIDHFSKRTAKIEEMAPKGEHSYREQKTINIKSRVAKGEYDIAQLEQYWRKEALQFGITQTFIESLTQRREGVREEHRDAAQVRHISDSRTSTTPQEEQKVSPRESSQWPDSVRSDREKTAPKIEPSYAEAKEQLERQREARKAAERAELKSLKEKYEREGHRVLLCTFKRDDVEAMNNAGIKSYTIARIWNDVRKETELEKDTKRSRGIKTKEDIGKDKIWRTAYAEYKFAMGEWSAKTRDKYKGVYYKPSSKLYHEWLYATHQIGAKQRDFMNRELEQNERRIDKKTVVMIYGEERAKQSPLIKGLIREVEKKGGKAVFVEAEEFRRKALTVVMQKAAEVTRREEIEKDVMEKTNDKKRRVEELDRARSR